jgi:predicted O-linked N-acetylglucosamine transferase (SPINDLY family)
LSRLQALEHLRAGRPQVALGILQSELRQQPADAQGWFLLGACHDALSEYRAAAEAFSRSLALDPLNVEAHLAHITVLRAAGDAHGALSASQRGLAQISEEARLSYAAALCLEDLGQTDDALAHYDMALEVAPAFADALHNRGLLLARVGRLDDAEANQRRFITAHPAAARAHSGLADVLLALGRFSDALEVLDAVERLSPEDISARVRRGVALASLRRLDEAGAAFSIARARDPHALIRYLQRIARGSSPTLILSPENVFVWQCHLAQGRCDWAHWSACAEELRGLHSKAVVEPAAAFIAFHQALDGRERLAVARHIAADVEARFATLPTSPARARAHIRVGILSPDLREHLNGHLLLPLFELLDRRRYELYAYSLAADDGSEIRSSLCAHADCFRELGALSDPQAAAAIRKDDIDILIDVAGHTTGGRFAITAQRPARLQVLYLGFPGSLGSERVDYAIVDRVVGDDPGEWTESLVYLPQTYYLYDFRSPVPNVPVTRKHYGLPEDGFVFCAFHKAEKISPDAFALWMKILTRVPRSALWLLSLPNAAQRNLRREAERQAVDPSRLIFAPFDSRDRYLARQRLGDLMLDTVHHSAMTTACDAMAAGLPVLTLRGTAMASKAGESLARAAGVPDLVAPDKEAYVELAVQLAADRERLNSYRRTLEARTGPLFDTESRVREIEAALMQMWRQYEQREDRGR